jgi:fatty-acyl-CoA synthase
LREIFAAKGVHFMSQYGGTETGPTITSLNGARVDKLRAGSCGQRVLHVQMRLVDEAGHDVVRGEPGEVWVKGPAVIKRYYGRDPEVDFPDGWFHTGDVAWEDDEGFLYIVDRVKDMYKSGGENVFPAEVELILASHPAVAEVSVIGVSDEQWGEVGLAVVVARTGQELTLESLQEICEGRLARFKQPKHLVVVKELPRNVTGKVAKQTLREMFRGSRSA